MRQFRTYLYQVFAVGVTLLFMTGCGATITTQNAGNMPLTYDAAAGHIIVQVFTAPGFTYPPIAGLPQWTLYGDGTLVYTLTTPTTTLATVHQAQLTPTAIQHILAIVVNQNAFFASTANLYGKPVADVGAILLTVDANGQHKTVRLSATPNADAQTQRLFASKQFLLGYHPASVQPYPITGVALLALRQSAAAASQGDHKISPWPYSTISLTTTATRECDQSAAGVCATPVGIIAINDANAPAIWQWVGGRTVAVENGVVFTVVAWPLLPDALHPTQGTSPHMLVAQSNQLISLPLLPPTP